MSKNTRNLKNKKIIAATAMTLFSLVSVFTATIAWFVLNQNVGGTGMSIKVKAEGGVDFSGIEIYKCISNKCTDTTLVFDNNPVSSFDDSGELIPNSTILMMEDYGDFINSDPVLMVFRLSTASTLSISAKTGTTTFGAAITSSNKDSYPLSNAVCFKHSTTISEVDDTFVVTSLSSSCSFVNTIPNAGSTSSLNRNITIYSSSTTEVSQVGIIVDYYSDAVSFIRTNLLAEDEDSGYTRVGFECDWSMAVTQ